MEDINKYNWVYQNSILLNHQNIEWSLLRTDDYKFNIKNINMPEYSDRIYIKLDPTIIKTTVLFLNKGEIKWQSDDIDGIAKLKLYSIISSHLSKFVGIIKVECADNFIAGLKLSFNEEDIKDAPKDVINKIGRHR